MIYHWYTLCRPVEFFLRNYGHLWSFILNNQSRSFFYRYSFIYFWILAKGLLLLNLSAEQDYSTGQRTHKGHIARFVSFLNAPPPRSSSTNPLPSPHLSSTIYRSNKNVDWKVGSTHTKDTKWWSCIVCHIEIWIPLGRCRKLTSEKSLPVREKWHFISKTVTPKPFLVLFYSIT